jgi:hypothetical protein
MNDALRLVPLAALLGAFALAGCAAGGGGGGFATRGGGVSACPSDRTMVNGECVLVGSGDQSSQRK